MDQASPAWARARSTLGAHWRAVAVGLALTVLATVLAVSRVQPTYEARASVLLLAPGTQQGDNGQVVRVNPFRSFDDSLRTTGTVIVEVLNSDATKERFDARGLSTSYTVEFALEDPLISISTLSGRASIAGRTRDALVRRFTDELDERQVAAGAPANEMITSSMVTASGPLESTGGRTRVGAMMLLLGTVLALGFPFLIDALRARQAQKHAPPPQTKSAPTPAKSPAKSTGRKQRAAPEVHAVATVSGSGNGNGNGNGSTADHDANHAANHAANHDANHAANGTTKNPARRTR
jgi:hypothetical protein